MKAFLSRFADLILFTLSGFDRLRVCGESRLLNHAGGVHSYLHQQRVLIKDYPTHARMLSERLVEETQQQLDGVPYQYLARPDIDKEAAALELAQQHQRTQGRIAVLSCQESALTYRVRGAGPGPQGKGLIDLRKEKTRCSHLYHYFLHEQFGLCYVRIGTWFPFSVRVGLNGRRWLAQQLRNRGVGFSCQDNLLTAVDDPVLAQQLLDQQAGVAWPTLMRELIRPVHPLWDHLHDTVNTPYYWMAEQSEWATDFLFRSRAQLAELYPQFLRHCGCTLNCKDVLRFLGKKVPNQGYGRCDGEAKIDLRERVEGTRVKFWYESNSLKIYDKGGVCLRLEMTLNQPKGYKVFRCKENDTADAKPSWQHLRKGVADMPRRAEVGQAAVSRLAESLAAVETKTPLGQLLEPLGRPVFGPNGRRVARALNPLIGSDGKLLRVIARGEFLVNGFRNRDVRVALHGESTDDVERRRQAGAVTRQLALLRAHGLIVKVTQTHRYRLSAEGHRVTAALTTAYAASIEQLAA